jgi:hypothetical protein
VWRIINLLGTVGKTTEHEEQNEERECLPSVQETRPAEEETTKISTV